MITLVWHTQVSGAFLSYLFPSGTDEKKELRSVGREKCLVWVSKDFNLPLTVACKTGRRGGRQWTRLRRFWKIERNRKPKLQNGLTTLWMLHHEYSTLRTLYCAYSLFVSVNCSIGLTITDLFSQVTVKTTLTILYIHMTIMSMLITKQLCVNRFL